jgi:hypothetical protein
VGKHGDNALAVTLKTPSGIHYQVPISGLDASGRSHSIVIPFDTPHTLFVRSASFVLKDSAGRDLDSNGGIDITAPSQGNVRASRNGAAVSSVDVVVDRAKD